MSVATLRFLQYVSVRTLGKRHVSLHGPGVVFLLLKTAGGGSHPLNVTGLVKMRTGREELGLRKPWCAGSNQPAKLRYGLPHQHLHPL